MGKRFCRVVLALSAAPLLSLFALSVPALAAEAASIEAAAWQAEEGVSLTWRLPESCETAFAAVYGENGTMLAVISLDASRRSAIISCDRARASYVKVFSLDSGYRPLSGGKRVPVSPENQLPIM